MSLINKRRAIRGLVLRNIQHCQVMMKARTFNDIIVSDGNQLLDDNVSDDLKRILQYHMGIYSIQNLGDMVMDRTQDYEYHIQHTNFVDNRIWFVMCFHTIPPEDEEERVEVIDMTNDSDSDETETDIDSFIDDVYFSAGEESIGEYDTDAEYCEDCREGDCPLHRNDDDE